MAIEVARRLAGLQQSDIRAMTAACERVGGINLGQGLGELAPPPTVRQAAAAAIEAGWNRYTPATGLPALREAIAARLARDSGLAVDPDSEVVVTAGATGAFAATLQALLDPGAGVLLPEPFYGYHLNSLLVSGLEPQWVATEAPALRLTEAALRAAVRPNTRALVLCTPANPSGRVLGREELETVARLAEELNLLVITDEIYQAITYDGHRHLPPATVAGLRARTVTIGGFSKTFSVTGWRLGYAVAPAHLAAAIATAHDLFYICAPAPLQMGAAAGLAADDTAELLRGEYQWRRDLLCEALAGAGMTPLVPEGAYYVLADISGFGYASARAAAMALLEQAGVAAIPGSAFFRPGAGEGWLRFCFAKDEAALREAAARLSRFRPAD